MARLQPFELKISPREASGAQVRRRNGLCESIGHAEFSARGPINRMLLLILDGSNTLEKNPGQANYSEARV